jgi:catechol 2,3-dioxygenase-like lactoylglutathione lyase family enzyme
MIHSMTRRELLLSIPALAIGVPRAYAQAARPVIPVKGLNHFTLAVSDVKRSLDFYQGLFGLPIQARQGATIVLRIGSGPQFLALSAAGSTPPSITHFCMTVENLNADRIIAMLAQHGIRKGDTIQAAPGDGGRLTGGASGGPMHVRLRVRNPEAGGAKDGTPELYVGDPDGIVVQLQDTTYCGGAGVLGNVCETLPEPSPTKGRLAVKDLSHVTISVSDADRSNRFYQDLFGLPIRSRQGASLGLGVGPGVMFVMFIGAAGAGRSGGSAARPASINHVCMSMENFNPDDILKTLATYGISPRGDAPGPVGPMKSYVSMRMPNRGGAPEGTPELYFTDPDGLLIQLQDASYCGGGGFLGNQCG